MQALLRLSSVRLCVPVLFPRLSSNQLKHRQFVSCRHLVRMSQLPPLPDSSTGLAAKGSDRQVVPSNTSASKILAAEEDCFSGMVIDPGRLPTDEEEFARSLNPSLSLWKKQVR